MEISVLVAVLLVLGTAFFGYESITHMDRLGTRLRSRRLHLYNEPLFQRQGDSSLAEPVDVYGIRSVRID
jgi:hypothetical protein